MSGACALAIEAATEQFSLAACKDERSAHWEVRPAREETQRIFLHATRVLSEVGAGIRDLDVVAFGCGPGSFTGVRIAAAATQAIAFARAIPVCRISTLAVLAVGAARATGCALIATCLDARMERASIALYRVATSGMPEPVFSDALIDPHVFRLPGTDGFAAVGHGWLAYPDLHARHRSRITALDADLLPSARDLLSMATVEFAAGRTVSAMEALPEYLGQAPAMSAGSAVADRSNRC